MRVKDWAEDAFNFSSSGQYLSINNVASGTVLKKWGKWSLEQQCWVRKESLELWEKKENKNVSECKDGKIRMEEERLRKAAREQAVNKFQNSDGKSCLLNHCPWEVSLRKVNQGDDSWFWGPSWVSVISSTIQSGGCECVYGWFLSQGEVFEEGR